MDSSATLLTIVDDGQPAGFALVARDTRASREVDYRMAEFFIARGRIAGAAWVAARCD